MTTEYVTQEDEMLDWICWRYYVMGSVDPSSSVGKKSLSENFIKSISPTTSGINGIIEAVLNANQGLSAFTILQPGLTILLPDINLQVIKKTTTHLWD